MIKQLGDKEVKHSKIANPRDYKFLYNLNLDQDVIRRLSIHLDNVYYGNNDVYLSPIGKDNDPKLVLSSWDKIFNDNRHKMNNVLIDLEMSNRQKYGPRSIAVPWNERKAGVLDYFDDVEFPIAFELYEGRKHNLRPISFDSAIDFLKNDTNSGLPYFTRKSKIKDKLYNKEVLDELKKRKDPCILFTRTQEDLKTRTVWGYPVYDTLNEMRYYRPLLQLQKNSGYRSALLGPEHVDKAITSLILRSIRDKLLLISVDFSAYDASVKYELQRRAFQVIENVFQYIYNEDILNIFDRFNSIGIITPDGLYYGPHGVPSGSTFTNEVDSIVQYILAMRTGIVRADNMQIQGDDGAYAIKDTDVDKLFDGFSTKGLNVNESKSYKSRDYLIYLQKLFHIDYMKDGLIGGIYPCYRAIERIVYQERWSEFEDYGLTGIDYYSIRAITILENCKYHPLFKELVQFIYRLDKYKLSFSQKSVNMYNEMVNQGQGSGGVLINQYGDEVTGINNFETVKIIKTLA